MEEEMKVLEVADGLEREFRYAAGIGGEDGRREEGKGRWAEESGVGMSVGWDAYVGKMSVDAESIRPAVPRRRLSACEQHRAPRSEAGERAAG